MGTLLHQAEIRIAGLGPPYIRVVETGSELHNFYPSIRSFRSGYIWPTPEMHRDFGRTRALAQSRPEELAGALDQEMYEVRWAAPIGNKGASGSSFLVLVYDEDRCRGPSTFALPTAARPADEAVRDPLQW